MSKFTNEDLLDLFDELHGEGFVNSARAIQEFIELRKALRDCITEYSVKGRLLTMLDNEPRLLVTDNVPHMMARELIRFRDLVPKE